ncbi:HD domain-containing protein [Gemmobacter serpentinus]|uniref:HD domain-containing protein n=1 Tax=Gemmobacter serpentinus TaxID=2652247 RepID=UPI00124DF1D2|nr:HD domain-containing protein [Gemmobacter serpentinus]
MSDRLQLQFDFLNAADRLKSVDRANVLMDISRPENVAEHSWHLALWALIMGAPDGVDLDRVIAMLLLHDLPEIDCGDHPIHLQHDLAAVAAAELAAAQHLFSLLPTDLHARFLALWQEFEAAETPEARLAKRYDHAQPIFQVLMAQDPLEDHLAVVRDNLSTGRAARFRGEWPAIHIHASDLLNGGPGTADTDLRACLAFLAEADRLKSVYRATTLVDASRPENSGEHSWHLALYALTLADQAAEGVDITRVIRMLLLHDLVEIDVGDVPIHSANGTAHGSTATQDAEARAADRIFGLLPAAQGAEMRALWDEFEAAESPDAVFAKSLDRVQPVMANLMSGGGTWISYQVTAEQLETRVGVKIARGAPQLWPWVRAQTARYFG